MKERREPERMEAIRGERADERRIAVDNVSSARTVFEWARGGSR